MIEVKLKTLTPLWTGNVDRGSPSLKESGIIGSLRWWYETLLRAYGKDACDPTDSKCNTEKHCCACELFGCTGWSRKFRLEIDSKLKPTQQLRIGNRYVSGLFGEFNLRIFPLRDICINEKRYFSKAFRAIHEYGALGARASQGNGVVYLEKIEGLESPIEKENASRSASAKNNVPVLSDFFFSKFQLHFNKPIQEIINRQFFWGTKGTVGLWEGFWENYGFLPIAFHARDAIRASIPDRVRRHEVFGERGKGSRVFVSHGYKIDDLTIEMRLFGYSLKEAEINNLKVAFKEKLPAHLSFDCDRPLKVSIEETNFKSGGQLL